MPAERVEAVVRALEARSTPAAAVIGRIRSQDAVTLKVLASREFRAPALGRRLRDRPASASPRSLEDPEVGIHQQADYLEKAPDVRVGAHDAQPAPVAQAADSGK